jgi:hypothetical protein
MDRAAPHLMWIPLEQAVGAVAMIVPFKVAKDRVEADALDSNTAPERVAHLAVDVAQPGHAQVTLHTGPGQE